MNSDRMEILILDKINRKTSILYQFIHLLSDDIDEMFWESDKYTSRQRTMNVSPKLQKVFSIG